MVVWWNTDPSFLIIFYIKKTKSSLEHMTQPTQGWYHNFWGMSFPYAYYSKISLTNYVALGKSLNFSLSLHFLICKRGLKNSTYT